MPSDLGLLTLLEGFLFNLPQHLHSPSHIGAAVLGAAVSGLVTQRSERAPQGWWQKLSPGFVLQKLCWIGRNVREGGNAAS